MKNEIVVKLKTTFWIIGWFFLATAVAGELFAVGEFLFHKPMDFGPNIIMHEPFRDFSLVLNLKLFSSGMASGFFCLLVSSAFSMISKGQAAKSFDRRLLYTVCIWFAIEGTVGVLSWVLSAYSTIEPVLRGELVGPIWTAVLMMLINGLDNLMPFLYAVTIWVLHRHFSKLISFESQVV